MSYEPPEGQPPPMPGGAMPPAPPPPPGAAPPPPQNLPPTNYGMPPPPPPYGAPPMPGYQQYGGPSPYPPADTRNTKATISLVLGIVSIVCFGAVLGVPAIVLGYLGLKDSEKMGGNGRGLAIGGLVTGIIGTLFTVAYVAFILSRS